jgi:hypothetical protein
VLDYVYRRLNPTESVYSQPKVAALLDGVGYPSSMLRRVGREDMDKIASFAVLAKSGLGVPAAEADQLLFAIFARLQRKEMPDVAEIAFVREYSALLKRSANGNRVTLNGWLYTVDESAKFKSALEMMKSGQVKTAQDVLKMEPAVRDAVFSAFNAKRYGGMRDLPEGPFEKEFMAAMNRLTRKSDDMATAAFSQIRTIAPRPRIFAMTDRVVDFQANFRPVFNGADEATIKGQLSKLPNGGELVKRAEAYIMEMTEQSNRFIKLVNDGDQLRAQIEKIQRDNFMGGRMMGAEWDKKFDDLYGQAVELNKKLDAVEDALSAAISNPDFLAKREAYTGLLRMVGAKPTFTPRDAGMINMRLPMFQHGEEVAPFAKAPAR